MIPLKLKHFEITEVRYSILNVDLAKFLISYWYGRTNALYGEYIISQKKKDFIKYIDSYNIFIRTLYVSGVSDVEIVKFVRDFLTSYFDNVLNGQLISKKHFTRGTCIPFFVLFHSFDSLNDLNEKANLVIDKILHLYKTKDYDVETWFKVLLGRRDFLRRNISDTMLIALVDNELDKFECVLLSNFEQLENRALRAAKSNMESDNLLGKSAGFFDYSSVMLKKGYFNIFHKFNSLK